MSESRSRLQGACRSDEAPLTTHPECPARPLMIRTTWSHTLRVPLGTRFPVERHSGVSLNRVPRGPGVGTPSGGRIILNALSLSLRPMAAARGCEF